MKKWFGMMLFPITLPLILNVNCSVSSENNSPQIAETILSDPESFFYLDTTGYPQNNPGLPIGIFDSGTGGLAVMEVIVNLDRFNNQTHEFTEAGDNRPDFEKEYFLFLADQANMPYGNYSRENNTSLLREHILKDCQFLLGRKYYLDGKDDQPESDKEPVKAIVIACNTATAVGKKDIDRFMDQSGLNVRVTGIIDAGVEGALEMFGKDEDGCIAVMATAGTVASGGYPETIERLKKEKNFRGHISVVQQAGIGLAGAIDGAPEFINPEAQSPRSAYMGPSDGNPDLPIDLSMLSRYQFNWNGNKMLYEGDRAHPTDIQINSVENYISYHLVSLLEKIRFSPQPEKVKSILLACTHYPFYQEIFARKIDELRNYRENGKFIYRPIIPDSVALIDPSQNLAIALYRHLNDRKFFNNQSLSRSEFYISVPNIDNPAVQTDPDGGFTYRYKYHRHAGDIQQYVKRVPFSTKNISEDTRHRLQEKVPSVYQLLLDFHAGNQKLHTLPSEYLFTPY